MPIPSILFYHFQVIAHRAEAVITAEHCRVRILHPAVVEIAAAFCQHFDKGFDATPGGIAEALRPLPVKGYPGITDVHFAGVLDGVFVQFHQIGIFTAPHSGNFYFFHQNIPPLYFLCTRTIRTIPIIIPISSTAIGSHITASPKSARMPLNAIAAAITPMALPKALP